MSCVACNTEKALNMMFIGQASQKYLKMTAVQSLLLRCYLHLWCTCSSSFASLLPRDLLPPWDVSAPGIAGGVTAPGPMGGTKARAWQNPAVWSVRHLWLPHPLGWSSTGEVAPHRSLEDQASLPAWMAVSVMTLGEHSSVHVLSIQGAAFSNFLQLCVCACLCVENLAAGLTIPRNAVVWKSCVITTIAQKEK